MPIWKNPKAQSPKPGSSHISSCFPLFLSFWACFALTNQPGLGANQLQKPQLTNQVAVHHGGAGAGDAGMACGTGWRGARTRRHVQNAVAAHGSRCPFFGKRGLHGASLSSPLCSWALLSLSITCFAQFQRAAASIPGSTWQTVQQDTHQTPIPLRVRVSVIFHFAKRD